MGVYVNPGNAGFAESIRDEYYADKTGMIRFMNAALHTKRKEICFTRPRRFGKTTAANMLAAYYSCGCDSEDLFRGLEIETEPGFRNYMNRFPVIYFGLISFLTDRTIPVQDIVKTIRQKILRELIAEYPDCGIEESMSLLDCLLKIVSVKNRKFIIIIDEWDMLFREQKENLALQREYIDFLRMLFRGNEVPQYLAGAYMTGILPIIRYDTQSALSDFREYSMLDAGNLGEYVGFTEEDVRNVCRRYPAADYEEMKKWYDGYILEGAGHIYCPDSVLQAAARGKYSSYWASTSAFESLRMYIQMNLDGLKDTVLKLMDGEEASVSIEKFENDLNKISTRDDVLTTLIHLGYLSYNAVRRTVRIPNLEIRNNFLATMSKGSNPDFLERIRTCDAVLAATREGNETDLAGLIAKVHGQRPPKHYREENALRYVILEAYYFSPDSPYTTFEELGSGRGFCDLLFLPFTGSTAPPMIIELKWGKAAEEAIKQIRDKDYCAVLRQLQYHGDVLLVGINYSEKTEKHSCRIEKVQL
ncbi:MAG: AAA family ATPase [Eubacteriales bacterium]|nr:AAA family ATPase [Eubacteriales bacterium]